MSEAALTRPRRLWRRRIAQNRNILLAYAGALAIFAVTSIFSPGFASENHVRVLLIEASFIGIVALGQTFVILGGGIDLTIPWTLNGAAILVSLFADGDNGPLVWAIPLVLALGAAVGLVNGLGIAILGINPIIMTLGANVIIFGAVLGYTRLAAGAPPSHVEYLATGRIGPVSVNTLIWAVLTVIATIVLVDRLRSPSLRARHEPDRRPVLRHRDRTGHDRDVRDLRLDGRAGRHSP